VADPELVAVPGGGSVSARWVTDAVRRVSRPDYPRWDAMIHAAGCCAQPVRLSGRVWTADPDGDMTVVYTTAGEADRVLLKACGNRRATRCPACAATYRADAKALLRAGLAIPDTDTETTGDDGLRDGESGEGESPVVFVTLTAPSFGPVHRAHHPPGPCHVGRSGHRVACGHGEPLSCGSLHEPGVAPCGTALCAGCYDWEEAVMFNARAGELWRRTTIAVARHLAAAAGVPARRFAETHRLEFAKVIEFQARGVVHVHALARLDQHTRPSPAAAVSNVVVDGAGLCAAFVSAAAQTIAPNPLHPDRPVRWGTQIDVQPIPVARRRAAAAYLAKYATKSVDGAGALDRRLRHGNLDHLDLPDQLRVMVATAWDLGGRPERPDLNLRSWAHSLGYRGHWLTKSRQWSTTFGRLRAARQAWRLAQLDISPDEQARRWGEWDYQGIGHTTPGDAWLAASANTARRQNRRAAWEHQ
jgi:hypothetical protein